MTEWLQGLWTWELSKSKTELLTTWIRNSASFSVKSEIQWWSLKGMFRHQVLNPHGGHKNNKIISLVESKHRWNLWNLTSPTRNVVEVEGTALRILDPFTICKWQPSRSDRCISATSCSLERWLRSGPSNGSYGVGTSVHSTLSRTPLDDYQPVAKTSTWQYTTFTMPPPPGGIQTRITSKLAATDPRLWPRGHSDRPFWNLVVTKYISGLGFTAQQCDRSKCLLVTGLRKSEIGARKARTDRISKLLFQLNRCCCFWSVHIRRTFFNRL